MSNGHAEPKKTKALPGSLEAILEETHARLYDAIEDSGLAGGQFYIHGVIPPDHVIVGVMGADGEGRRYLDITYTEGSDGSVTVLGAMSASVEVTVIEELVTSIEVEVDEMGEGGYLSDDTASAKADDGETGFKSFEIKADNVARAEINGVPGFTFEGYFSEWNTADNERDITRPGFVDYSLQKWGLPPVRYEHAMNAGVVLEVKSDEYGPWCKGFVPDDPQTSLMYKLMKVGGVAKMSYGYKVLPGGATRLPTGERELKAIRLMEISPVAIPMHDGTEITSVKSPTTDGPIKLFLAEATRAVYTAGARVKEFSAGRAANGEALGDDNWSAITAFATATADALADCTGAEVKAGRTTAKARWKLIAQLRDTLSSLIDSIPEDERADGDAKDEAGKGQRPAPVTDPEPDSKGDDTAPTSADVWRLEMDLLTRKLAHHGQRINHAN